MVRDIVCGMDLEPRKAIATAEHEGRLYYFCSKRCHNAFVERPQVFTAAGNGMRMTVGVMGSAGADSNADIAGRAYQLGEAIAEHELILVTGACPGLPYECARGAIARGGLSIGVSPALSFDEHVHKYLSPSDAFSMIVYTGSGLMGREVTNIRSSDIVIILGGRSGTLGEFAIAYDEGKLIGVLSDSGGITSQLPALVESFGKDTGAKVVYERDPGELLDRLLSTYTTEHYRCPSCFCSEMTGASG